MPNAAQRQKKRDAQREKNRENHRRKRDAQERKYAAAKASHTPTAEASRLVTRAETLVAESRVLLDEIAKNYTSGAAKLATSYGALIEDELNIAQGEEVKELESEDAPIKVIASAYTRQTRAREFLLNLGPKIFAAMEIEGEGSTATDPMVLAAQRIAQANEGEIELVRESVILKANPEEDDEYAPSGSYVDQPAGVEPGR